MRRSLLLHNDTRELPLLVEFIDGICRELGIARRESMSLQLAMEEAVVNIMQYAFKPDAQGNIEVYVECDADRLVFRLEDGGVAFDPTDVADADVSLSASEREIGGLGIYIIRQIMDRVEYCRTNDRNILRLTKFIKR